jgi:hypothetical protein
MKFVSRLLLAILLGQSVLVLHPAGAQTEKQKPENKAAVSAEARVQKQNVGAYIDLLRKDVRQQKAEIMGAVRPLSAGEDLLELPPAASEHLGFPCSTN